MILMDVIVTALIPPTLPPPSPARTPPVSAEVLREVQALQEQARALSEQADRLMRLAAPDEVGAAAELGRLGIFNGYIGVFVVAFLVSLLATPVMRRLALVNGIMDRPSEARKGHRLPVAYLGGVAVWLGVMAGVVFSYTAEVHGLMSPHPTRHEATGFLPGGVPLSIVLGMTAIMLVGLIDDVMKISPRIKIAGQLAAAAALAVETVGANLAAGLLVPMARTLGIPVTAVGQMETILLQIPLGGGMSLPIDVVYWTGTALIAIFVLGACNASNLIDGLDGLLTGTTAIAAFGLLVISLGLAVADNGPLDGPRVVLCLAVLGACLGFLPHNFNPATIFLGDAGSLLLGYCTIVIVMSLGDKGHTSLVLAGLIIYAIPIIDTTLAIIRRKIAGRSISEADDQHLHHMLKRALGVKGAVLVLYLIAAGFAGLGVALTLGRGRITYALALVFAAFIGVTAFKSARQKHIEEQTAAAEAMRNGRKGLELTPPAPPTSPTAAAAQPVEPVATRGA